MFANKFVCRTALWNTRQMWDIICC